MILLFGIATWLLFTLVYFRSEFFSVRKSVKALEDTGTVGVMEILGSSQPVFFAQQDENSNVDSVKNNENSEIETEFDVEYEESNNAETDLSIENDSQEEAIEVSKTFEELQQAVNIVCKTDATKEEERQAGKTLNDLKDTELLQKLNETSADRIAYLMKELEMLDLREESNASMVGGKELSQQADDFKIEDYM